jgi:hypothetical protein
MAVKTYVKGDGVFVNEYRYYSDGFVYERASNTMEHLSSWSSMKSHGSCVSFATYFRKSHRSVKSKTDTRLSIITGDGYRNVSTLDLKYVSHLKLDTRKTWFVVWDENKRGQRTNMLAMVGFRRVPRKWVPEMNALLVRF